MKIIKNSIYIKAKIIREDKKLIDLSKYFNHAYFYY